jgi:hypothetical protein
VLEVLSKWVVPPDVAGLLKTKEEPPCAILEVPPVPTTIVVPPWDVE